MKKLIPVVALGLLLSVVFTMRHSSTDVQAQGTTFQTKRIDQYSDRTSTADPNDMFLLEDNTMANYWNQTRASLNRQFVNQLPNLWAGPTNVIDMNVANHNNGDLYYITFTPVAITSAINEAIGGSSVQTVTITFLNVSGSNVTLTIPSFMLSRDGLRQYTITNGQSYVLSARYHPSLARLYSVSCPNY